jgi:DNA invertase Pin-like site-specific DNA recombinase
MTAVHTKALAYSYIRFSDLSQQAGDSVRRQADGALDWCTRNYIRLDTNTTLHDLGKSAFLGEHRKNPDRHALARFLKLVEDGRVPRGSYLIIENLDRLSREHIRPALTLLLNLIEAGIRVVQLKPVEQIFDENVEPMALMMAIMELSRGHNESAIKSQRVGAAWEQRRKKARAKAAVLTRKLPAWIEERSGKLVAIPERAAAVKRIFDLAGSGHGLFVIRRKLTEEGVPAFGPSGRWSVSYLDLILRDRRALGELQPKLRGGKPDGDVIPDYFPRIVSEEVFEQARLGARERYRRPGRVSGCVNLFQGLLRGAGDGVHYTVGSISTKNPHRVLRSAAPRLGLGSGHSFPLEVFERAILSQLAEIDPHEILNGDTGPDESIVLAGQLAGVEARIAVLEAELMVGDVAALARVLRQLEERKRDLAARLAEAREKAYHPLSEAWGEAQTLLAALDAAPDAKEARLRLRSALRRMIDSVWMLVVPQGLNRVAAVQVWFADGNRHRDYAIYHWPNRRHGKVHRPAGYKVVSLADAEALGELDLRKPAHAKRLEKALTSVDVNALNR